MKQYAVNAGFSTKGMKVFDTREEAIKYAEKLNKRNKSRARIWYGLIERTGCNSSIRESQEINY